MISKGSCDWIMNIEVTAVENLDLTSQEYIIF